jgi:hypothetical protein
MYRANFYLVGKGNMDFEFFYMNASILAIVGMGLGVFLLMILLMMNKTQNVRTATRDVRSIIRKVMALSFIIGFVGVLMWQSGKRFSPNLGDQILNVFTKISTTGKGKIIAEKENGKIVIAFRKSCIKEFVGAGRNAGLHLKEHWIYTEFSNHFDHSVVIREFHVNSRLDDQEIPGYRITDKSKTIIKPGETEIIKLSAHLPAERIEKHLELSADENPKPTQEISFITSEGPLPPIPVIGAPQNCLD